LVDETLVIGGAGFIGNHLVQLFVEKQIPVSVLDLKPPELATVPFYKTDITKETSRMTDAFCDVEYVIHLAAAMGVSKTESRPVHTLETNIFGLRNVLEMCRRFDIRKLVLTSSSEVYGEPDRIPISETDECKPVSVYGVSKLAGEYYVRSFATEYGLNYTIVRYFNVYGPGQSEDFVVPSFVGRCLRGEELTVYGDGQQIRAFCNVRDAVRGTFLSMSNKAADRELFNIGNDTEPATIVELANRIVKMCGQKQQLRFVPIDQTVRANREIHRRIPNIEKAGKVLGYKPEVELSEGLLQVIEHMQRKCAARYQDHACS
jgi:UDP-glucose 4-epimerase